MRKKLAKIAKSSPIIPKQIVTFQNQDFVSYLTSHQSHKITSSTFYANNCNTLKMSAAAACTAVLSTNQIMNEQRIIAIKSKISRSEENKNWMKWIDQKYEKDLSYEIYTDPQIVKGEGLIEQREESISFPLLRFMVKRYQKITVRYRDEMNIKEEKQLEGFCAWAFQQGLQQLNGRILFDWRINHGNISIHEDAIQYFPRTTSLIEEYCKDLKKVFQDYPQLLTTKDSFNTPRQYQESYQRQPISIQLDTFSRLMKHFGKQMNLLSDRMALKQKQPVWHKKNIEVKILQK